VTNDEADAMIERAGELLRLMPRRDALVTVVGICLEHGNYAVARRAIDELERVHLSEVVT
jgi:hypothetical protein